MKVQKETKCYAFRLLSIIRGLSRIVRAGVRDIGIRYSYILSQMAAVISPDRLSMQRGSRNRMSLMAKDVAVANRAAI